MKNAVYVFCLILGLTVSSLGFVSPDFSGNWIRDTGKIDSMGALDGMVVSQSDASLDVEPFSVQNPEKQVNQNDQLIEVKTPYGSVFRTNTKVEKKFSYLRDGNEHSITDENGTLRTYRVTQNGDQLIIENTSTTNTPFGKAEIKVKEEWSLSADGRTLIITTVTSSAAGTQTQTRIFSKQL